jgi:fumarate reductase flavoprotein subunit
MNVNENERGVHALEIEANIKETLDADVLVCGTGAAGLAAAVRAAQLGAKVIVFEKHPEESVGGSSTYTSGVFGYGSSMMPKKDGLPTADDIYAATIEYHKYACNLGVTRRFVDTSGATVDWLIEQGVKFEEIIDDIPCTHQYTGADENNRNAGKTTVGIMYARAQKLGVIFYFETPCASVLLNDGKLVGALSVDNGVGAIKINTSVVILCTGGYASSREMFDRYTTYNFDSLENAGLTGRDGDGINIGLAAGGALHLPTAASFCSPTMRGEAEEGIPHSITCNQQPCIWVNEGGVRFTNEETISDWTYSSNAIGLEHRVYSIVDTAFFDYIIEHGLWYGATGLPVEELMPGVPKPNVYEMVEMDRKLAEDDPVAFRANSIHELALAMGIDPDGLVDTVEKYNDYCMTGKDPLGKSAQYLLPLTKAPYYGFSMLLLLMNTCGGLKIDEFMRVISKSGRFIPGLYACGCDAGGIFGYYYDYTLAPGSMQGWGYTSGKLAGEHATEYLDI